MTETHPTTENLTPQQIAADVAREYREDLRRWTQGHWARDANGYGVGTRDSRAVCWCLRGAIDKRLQGSDQPTFDAIYRAFDKAIGCAWEEGRTDNHVHFVAWNDRPGRTVREVIELCEKVAAS